MVVLSFSVLMIVFVLIGVSSVIQSKKTNGDYLLAGRQVKPWLVALSAVSTNNSGYMFIGQIGFTYLNGLSSIWLMIGWLMGDFIGSLFIHPHLRAVSEKRELLSFGGIISQWQGTHYPRVKLLVGVITILFLGTYAAAQFKAGGKALQVLFGWDYSVGAIMGAFIVFLYCLAGGIRASIWTDAAQSFVMIGSMILLCAYSISAAGGFQGFWESAISVSPVYMDWFPELALGGMVGPLLFVTGWIFAGFGVVGQPHVMVRFMTLDDPKSLRRVRAYYYSWFAAFYLLAITVGLASRILLPVGAEFDPELALPTLARSLLPEAFIGIILAGLFAATMSTADSQILSCAAALTKDVFPKKQESYLFTKIGTFIVTLFALLLALYGGTSVFALVLIAWSVLASAFGPILLLYAFGKKISEVSLICMIAASTSISLIWYWSGMNQYIYEIVPGIFTGLLVYFVFTRFAKQ